MTGSQAPALAATSEARKPLSIWLVYLVGMLFWAVVNYTAAQNVWTTGTFLDTDDAMKLVELRDWLAGQNWFDMTSTRMDPPLGVAMHWSRLYDMPLAALFAVFHLFLDADHSERAMRIVFPGLMYLSLVIAVVRIAKRLMGDDAVIFAVLFTSLSVAGCFFVPGAIDHHGAQTVLLVLMLALTLDSIDATSVWGSAWAGTLAALSLEISVENLPFITVMIASFGILFVIKGSSYKGQIKIFAISFALSALAAFFATIAPKNYGHLDYDAFSVAHVGAACIGGIGFLVLCALGDRLKTVQLRVLALMVCGGISGLLILLLFPGFLKDPLIKVVPLVREYWLDNVGEAKPLLRLLREEPMGYIPLAGPMLLALAVLVLAVRRAAGNLRILWSIILAFCCMGLLGTFWQVRVAPLVMPIFGLAAVWAVLASLVWSQKQAGRLVKILPLLVAVPFINIAWGLALPDDVKPAVEIAGDGDSCFQASAFRPFRTLPKGIVLSMIDPGPHFLALTDHSVVTGPFHRDNHGLSLTIQTWKSVPDEAEHYVRESGATYLAFCAPSNEFRNAAKVKTSLAARLYAGEIPEWLTELHVADTPYRVFAVK
eukprot:gene2513-2552_t